MAELRAYVVRQGDHLTLLAERFGFALDDVWNHPKNESLRSRRRGDLHLLLPGDVLYIPDVQPPWLPVTLGTRNIFKAPQALVSLVVRFVAQGRPLAGERYEVEGADVAAGTLDSDGYFRASVPARVSTLRVRLPARNEEYVVNVGDLDPADTPTGAHMRLGLLGLGTREGGLRFGLRRFQKAQGLRGTGELDPITVDKLREVFGR